MTLKEYVNDSVEKKELISYECLLLANFNKNVDRIDSLFCNNQRYHDLIMSYGNMGDDGVWLIVILINLLSCNSRILKCNDYIIDIIVNAFFEEEYSIDLYSRYLKICLFDENVRGLEQFYYMKSIGIFFCEIEDMLSAMLNTINLYQSDSNLKKELNAYYEKMIGYYSPADGSEFKFLSSLDEIYVAVLDKMEEIQEFVDQYGQKIFQLDDFENIKRIKLLEAETKERKDEFLQFFREISSMNVSIICKILNINAKIVECTKEVSEVQTELKIVPFRKRGSKDENR